MNLVCYFEGELDRSVGGQLVHVDLGSKHYCTGSNLAVADTGATEPFPNVVGGEESCLPLREERCARGLAVATYANNREAEVGRNGF